jgi:aminoglycoside phosphotransferase family enzyme
MKSLINFIKEEKELDEYIKLLDMEEIQEEYLLESSPIEGKVSSDTKGKMHEILVGYHLKGGKHMSKHPDKAGDSPKQAHDKLKLNIHPNDYKKINSRAKSAANDIKKQVETNGHKIHDVHWTSKPGDIHRSTGIHASQNEDSSDIVITTHKK